MSPEYDPYSAVSPVRTSEDSLVQTCPHVASEDYIYSATSPMYEAYQEEEVASPTVYNKPIIKRVREGNDDDDGQGQFKKTRTEEEDGEDDDKTEVDDESR